MVLVSDADGMVVVPLWKFSSESFFIFVKLETVVNEEGKSSFRNLRC